MSNWSKRKPKTFTCVQCGNIFSKISNQAKLCSKECFVIYNNAYQLNRRKKSIEASLRHILYGCKNRARRHGLEYDLSVEFILNLLKMQEHKCAVTKIPLEATAGNTKTYSSPKTISIDRIDSNRGYTKDNVRLVTYMYNSCKGQWTDEQVREMCVGVLS